MNREILFNQPGKKFFFNDAFKVAKYVKENCQREAAGIIKAADDVAAKRFMFTLRWDMERTTEPVIFDNEIDWLHQPGDDPEWVFAFNRMRFWICLGQAYALTGDEKYANAFAEQMCHWVKTVKLDDPDCAKAWRSIEVGLRLEYWLKAMQYFRQSPAITDEVARIFVESVTEQAEFIMGVWNSYNLMSNWGVLANHGLFMAGVMLPDTPRTKEYTAEAVRRLTAEINMQVYRDGSHWEQSPMYHNEVLHCFLDVVLLSDRCGVKLPELYRDKTLKMCLYDLASGKPNHSEPMMGDSDDIDQQDQISKGAVIFKNPYLKFRGYDKPDFDTIWDIGEDGLKEYEALESADPESADFFLPDSVNAFMRSGWGEKDTWVHFQCGPLGAGHGHADKLHVDLFSRGEDILTDAGRYTYVFGRDRIAFKEMAAHNTVMVDNHELYTCMDSWECDRLTRAVNKGFYADNKYAYAEGGHTGYTDIENGVLLNRRVIYLKPDIIVLADEFYTSGNHKYNQFFHFRETGGLTEIEGGYRFTGQNAQADILFMTEGITTEITDTRVSKHYNDFSPAKGVKTEFSAEGPGCAYTVIFLEDAGRNMDYSVDKLTVKSNFKNIVFSDEQVTAFNIKYKAKHFTLALAHKEFATPTDTFLADGCIGFGSAVVFDRADGETETGTVLAW